MGGESECAIMEPWSPARFDFTPTPAPLRL